MFKLACLTTAVGVSAVKVEVASHSHGFLHVAGGSSDDEEAKNLAKPLSFHQKLLVCNAYPSEDGEGMVLAKNGVSLKSHENLAYNSCKYVDGKIFNKDRVSFALQKSGVEGTFEVDELPASDSVLLLIAQKRDAGATALMSFQSFAFPAADPRSNDAQVAFINTIPDTDDSERIRMSDDAKNVMQKASREEDVLFNRVYVIDQGEYKVDIVGGQYYEHEKKKAEETKKADEKKAEETKKHAAEEKKHAAEETKAHQLAQKKDEHKAEKKVEKVEKKAEKKVGEKKVEKKADEKKTEKKVEEKKVEKKEAKSKKIAFLQEAASASTERFFTSKNIGVQLQAGQDYVILQTGTAENPTLIAFPGPPQSAGIVGFFKRMFSWI